VQTPLQLTFRSMAHSDALAAHIRRRAEELERLFDRIISCHVVIELAGHHHRKGDRYRVSINLGLSGHELIVSHDPSDNRDLESAQAAADRAFIEMARQLEDWVKRKRGDRHVEHPSQPD
jgi:ribosome-associated translation inhibitor RaiA